jgi:hypothetical protein
MDKETVHKFLRGYDCPFHYNGYTELLDLIIRADGYYWDIVRNLKIIYMDTADSHQTTRLCLERNLRTLTIVWSKERKFHKLFKSKPTNAELIVTLVEMIHKKKQEEQRTIYDCLLN